MGSYGFLSSKSTRDNWSGCIPSNWPLNSYPTCLKTLDTVKTPNTHSTKKMVTAVKFSFILNERFSLWITTLFSIYQILVREKKLFFYPLTFLIWRCANSMDKRQISEKRFLCTFEEIPRKMWLRGGLSLGLIYHLNRGRERGEAALVEKQMTQEK